MGMIECHRLGHKIIALANLQPPPAVGREMGLGEGMARVYNSLALTTLPNPILLLHYSPTIPDYAAVLLHPTTPYMPIRALPYDSLLLIHYA